MKTKFDRIPRPVGRVTRWLEAPSPPHSLAIGATCGCDMTRLEREVCETLNRIPEFSKCGFSCLDFLEVRHLAGQPGFRGFITHRADLDPEHFVDWNDHDLVLRGLASFGGLVLGGTAAIEATIDLPNVCRIMLSDCELCDEADISGRVEPHANHIPHEYIDDIIERFTAWLDDDDARHDWEPRQRLRDVGTAASLM